MTFLAVFVLFSIIILIHEFGHYLVARVSGVQVISFNLGFGPVLFSKIQDGTLYAFRLLPFGGFVQLAGLDESVKAKVAKNKKYNEKTILQRFAIIAAGAFLNVVLALTIFILIYSLIGVPKGPSDVIGYIVPGSAAQQQKLLPGDKLIRLNGAPITDILQTIKQIHNTPAGSSIDIVVERKNERLYKTLSVTTNVETKKSYVGVMFYPSGYQRLSFFKALSYGAQETWGYTKMFALGLSSMFSKTFFNNVAGPVGIISVSAQAVQQGYLVYFKLMAILSLNIGLLNLLPFPALDGGRLIFILYEAITRRKPNPEAERIVHTLGFLLLLVLIISITYQDILKLSR